MKRINARDFLLMSHDEIWGTVTGKFILVFDDGEIETKHVDIKYNTFIWDLHRKYPKTPMLLAHYVRTIIGKGRLKPNTHLKLIGNVVWCVKYHYPEIPVDTLAKDAYVTMNKIYNEMVVRIEEHISSIDIIHFIQILDNPKIKESNESVEDSPASIDATYKTIMDQMAIDPVLRENPLAKAGVSGIVNTGQLLQCLGPRGFLTDINSRQFTTPIKRGYAEGIRLMYDHFIESRSAAKALIFSKKPLQDAEYFSRRLQLMCQIVRNLHHGDCGSTNYLSWHVTGPIVDPETGKTVFKGDLEYIKGKHYIEDGVLKTVKESDTHLIGKLIKMRSPFDCQHTDPYGICSTCFGELSETVPPNSNIGHMCCTELCKDSSQSVLSTKHLDTSASVDPVCVDPMYRQWIGASKDGTSYVLEHGVKGKISLIFSAKEATNITDILQVDNVEDLNISRVSELSEIGLKIETDTVTEELTVPVKMNNRFASMTYALLKHIRNKGWSIDDKGNYVVDMTGYDKQEPILTLELKHYNMSLHSADISKLLESTVKDLKKRDKVATPGSILFELYRLVNTKLNVNLAVLEVVLYGIMIVSADEYDYRLPKPWTERGIGVRETIMAYRSLSAAMAYEDHKDILTHPLSFLLRNRPNHPLDRLLMGEAV